MWKRLSVFILILFEVFSVHLPGVEITVNGDKVRFECENVKDFRKLETLKLVFDESIGSIELDNCLEDKNNTFNFEHNPFSRVKSITIISKYNFGSIIPWNLNDKILDTLVLRYSYPQSGPDMCSQMKTGFKLDNLKHLKSFEYSFRGFFVERMNCVENSEYINKNIE